MRLKPQLVDIPTDWEDHHALGGQHRLYIQPIYAEAEIGLIGNRQGDQRGFEVDSRLLRNVRERLEANGFQVTSCPGAGENSPRCFLVVTHAGAQGAELGALAENVLEQNGQQGGSG